MYERCLYCYKELKEGQVDYHPACSKARTNLTALPLWDYGDDITGNADMHLKNFSLYNTRHGYTLTPAYDLLATTLIMPEEPEELALMLNGKKRKIRRSDFVKSMSLSGLNDKVIENIAKIFRRALPKWLDFINRSFLPEDLKRAYKHLILQRMIMLR